MRARTITTIFFAVGLLGCLRAFGPDLRAVGPHAGLQARPGHAPAGSCMDCHESEADAIERIAREPAKPARDPNRDLGPPLVADWMVAETRPCTDCHRVRP